MPDLGLGHEGLVDVGCLMFEILTKKLIHAPPQQK